MSPFVTSFFVKRFFRSSLVFPYQERGLISRALASRVILSRSATAPEAISSIVGTACTQMHRYATWCVIKA